MLNPTRTLFRWWGPCLAACLIPLTLLAFSPGLAASVLGWAALLAVCAAASFGAAAVLSRSLREAVDRASTDIENALRLPEAGGRPRYDWGLLKDLAGVFQWLTGQFNSRLGSAEKELRLERTRFDAMLAESGSGIVVAGPDGALLYANPAFKELLGPSPAGEAAGAVLGAVARHEALRRAVESVLAGRAASERLEFRGSARPGGSERLLEGRVARLGQDAGVLVTVRELTLEREAGRLKEEFLRAVVHDLRAPLFGMRGYLRLLEKAGVDPKQKGYLASIDASCDRLDRLVEDVRDLARLDSPQPELEGAAFSAEGPLRRAVEALKAEAEEKGVALALLPLPGAVPQVKGEERLVARAVELVAVEALRLSPKGSKLAFELKRPGPGELELIVRHGGPSPAGGAFDPFESFQRLDAEGGPAAFGLGLALAARVVRAHGGRAWAQAEPGGGAFILSLPCS